MSIKLEHINYIYNPGDAYERHALKDINLEIPQGQFVGIIGHTGSGKSTLIQHLNGLIKATSGQLYYEGKNIYEAGYNMRTLRTQVGLVFQYPEHQLFEVDVLTDVCFGPKNQGLSEEDCMKRAKEALELVQFPEKYYRQSPFELSGGQKRRVAIAGVLAMKPKVLVLDEPTAGLDPQGRDDILDQIARLHKETDMTVILVSHSMEDIARYVDRIIVMNHGEKMFDGEPKAVFAHYKELEQIGLAAPQVTYIMHDLKERGLDVRTDATTVEEAADEIMRCYHDCRYYNRTVLPCTKSGSSTGSKGEDYLYADIFSIVVCTEQSAGLCSCNHIFNDCNQSKPSSAQIYAQRLEGNRYFIVIYGCDEFIFDKRRRDTGTFLDFYNYRTRA